MDYEAYCELYSRSVERWHDPYHWTKLVGAGERLSQIRALKAARVELKERQEEREGYSP